MIWGKQQARLGPESPEMSPGQPERRRTPHRGLAAHMQRRQAGGPRSPGSLHFKQARHEQTRQRLKWSPVLSTEVDKGPQGSPALSQLYPKSHTYSNNTLYCPGLKQKPNHNPKFKKQPSENDMCPSGSRTSPQALSREQRPVLTHCLLRTLAHWGGLGIERLFRRMKNSERLTATLSEF